MKYITALLCLIIVLTTNAQMLKPFTLEGDISSINDNIDSMHLSYTTDGKKYDLSFPVKNSRFVIKGNISQPTVAMIYYFASTDTTRIKYISTDNTSTQIFIQAGKMSFKSGPTISENTLTGSPYDRDFKEINEKKLEYSQKPGNDFDQILLENDTILRKQKVMAFLDSSKDYAVQLWLSYLNSNPQSPLVFYGVSDMMAFNSEFQGQDVAPIYDKLTTEMKNSYEGKHLKAIITVGNGSIAPEFSQADTAGVMVTLSSFRGKYVLLDFWGSWCHPCRKENPNLIKNFEKYKDKGFTIISIAADDDKAKWLGAIHTDGVGMWTHVSDLKRQNNEVAKLYCVNSYPSNFLINPDGVIIAQNLRGDVLDKKLAEIFK